MLAMGMATSCSDNESFEAVVNQPQEGNIVTLSADIAMPVTRATIEGVEGTENAFNFTGWRDGETLIGVYGDASTNRFGTVDFTYNAKEGKFFSDKLPEGVTPDQFLQVVTPAFDYYSIQYYGFNNSSDFSFPLGLPVSVYVSKEKGWADFPLTSFVTYSDGELIAKMGISDLALACVSNNTARDLSLYRYLHSEYYNGTEWYTEDRGISYLGYYVGSNYSGYSINTYGSPEVVSIPAGSKAYILMPSASVGLSLPNGSPLRLPRYLESGKVYSLDVDAIVGLTTTSGGKASLTDTEGNPVVEAAVAKGTKLVATAEATKEGSLFAGWVNEKGEIVSTKSVYEFEADGYVALRAVFEGWEKFATGEFGVGLSDVKPVSGAIIYRSYSDPTLFKIVGHELFSAGFLFTMSSDFSNIRTLKQDLTLDASTTSHLYAEEGRGAFYSPLISFSVEYVNQDGLVKEANPYFLFDMKNPIDNIGIKDGIWQDEEDL